MHDTSAAHVAHQHAAPTGFIRKHIFSLDHKVIGKQYYGLALLAVFIGMVLSWLMRVHLGWPAWPIPLLDKLSAVGAPQGVMTPEYYLSLMTMHGTLMVFFVLTNAPFAAFGNYFLPIQIGAEDMAFPRFNMMSFWTTFVAFAVLVAAFFIPDGPPISTWAWFITSCIGLLAFAVLLPACLLLLLDRMAGTSFFIPSGLVVSDRLQNHAGGSPLLWQHLFWFFGHPEVYIAILPAVGIVSHVL